MPVYSFTFPRFDCMHWTTNAGRLWFVLHFAHLLSTVGCLGTAWTAGWQGLCCVRAQRDGLRTPEVLLLSGNGKKQRHKHSSTCTALLLERQLCSSSTVGQLTLSGHHSPLELPKCPHCSTGPCRFPPYSAIQAACFPTCSRTEMAFLYPEPSAQFLQGAV